MLLVGTSTGAILWCFVELRSAWFSSGNACVFGWHWTGLHRGLNGLFLDDTGLADEEVSDRSCQVRFH